MLRRNAWIGVLALAGCLAGGPAAAWWPVGHGIISKAAVRALPEEVPGFFRAGGDMIAHMSFDPDVAKHRAAPNVNDQEYPEHYIDHELLEGRTLPPTRYEFLKLCADAKLDPKKVGLVPYAITEWTERLAIGFAEHRKWPNNLYIRQKCLVYAGFLSHYAGDMCQPLHTTVHFDGRVRADGNSPRSGIHNKVDALIERLQLKPEDLARDQKVAALDRLFPAVLAQLDNSRGLVERVYQLEAKLPPTEGPIAADPEVVAFAMERARQSTRFLASLYLTAWRKSHTIQLPPWLEREAEGGAAAAR